MADGPPDQYDYDPAYEINTDSGWLKDGQGNAVMGEGIDVKLDGLQGYSQNIHQVQQNFNSMAATIMGPLSEMARGAFGAGQGLPWATFMATLIGHNIEQLSTFNQNMSIGVMNVSSAAQVVANVYGDTDAGSAANLQAVNFAFVEGGAPDSVPKYVLDNVQTWNEFTADNPGVAERLGPDVNPIGGTPEIVDANTTRYRVEIPQAGGPPIVMVTEQHAWSSYSGGPMGVTTTVTLNGQVQSVTTRSNTGGTTTTRVVTSFYDDKGTKLRDRVTRESTETVSVQGSGATTTTRTDSSSTSYQYDEDGEQTDSTTTTGTVAVGMEHPDLPLPDPRDDPMYEERMRQLPQYGN